jgi:hypothetical protein
MLPFVVGVLANPWRTDGRCGGDTTAADGTHPAQCNPWDPNGRTFCAGGLCTMPTEGGVDYRIRTTWRRDGRCGADVKSDDGIAHAICNPFHPQNLTCCSEEGWCGPWPSYAHCRCKDCVNYFRECSCRSEDSPCEDPATARCYPRSTAGALAEEVEARRKQEAVAQSDRRPEADPRRSMRLSKMDREAAELSGSGSRGDQAHGGRTQLSHRASPSSLLCPPMLVDCLAASPPPPQPPSAALPAVKSMLKSEAASRHAREDEGTRLSPQEDVPRPPGPAQLVAVSGDEVGGYPTRGEASPHSPTGWRLASGPRSKEGRLEVQFAGSWGTVCSEGFGWQAAHVACRTLGFGGVDSLYLSSDELYGSTTGRIWISNVACAGDELRLEDCRFYGLGHSTIPPKCTHRLDVGLVCSYRTSSSAALPQQRLDGDSTSALHRPSRNDEERHPESSVSGHQPSLRADGPDDGCASEVVRSGKVTLAETCGDVRSDLQAALDALERAVLRLEARRPVIDQTQLARLSRLRLRLHRLAGTRAQDLDQDDENLVEPHATQRGVAPVAGLTTSELQDLGVSEQLTSRLPPDLLEELRRMPRKSKPLHESRAEFEEQMRLERLGPLADDPLEQQLRRHQEENHRPAELRPPPLREPKPHERLLKPPIQNLPNRRPPDWQDAHEAVVQYTREQIRLGLAPEGIEKVLEPGPWHHDPAFWSETGRPRDVQEHELDEDIVFHGGYA